MPLVRSFFILALIAFGASSFSQTTQCKCCDQNHKQFNFWMGEWKVYDPSGKFLGENSIQVMQDSCLLQENWTSATSGYRGTSYNFYNQKTKKWQQLWIDNQGSHLELEGEFSNDKMTLQSKEIVNATGQKQVDRITWTCSNDGQVRQIWDRSLNGGTSWETVFDGIYKKQQP